MSKKYLTSEKLLIPNSRMSFPRLDKPAAYSEGQALKYDATFLLDPSNAEHKTVIKTVEAAAMKLVKEKFNGVVPDDITWCFGKGDKKATIKPDTYGAYKGMWYLTAHEQTRPGIAGRDGKAVLPGEKQFPYAGCYVNGKVTLWLYTGPKGKPGVNANLLAVQFVKDGPAFGRAPVDVEEEFDAIEENEEAPSPFD